MNIPGYNPSHVINPWVFADYGDPPTRLRGQVSPVVMQTGAPTIRDPYMDAIVDALHGDGPTGGGTFVGGQLAPGSSMLGNYQDRSQRGGRLAHEQTLVVYIQTEGVNDTQATEVLRQLDARLRGSPMFRVAHIGWGTGPLESTILIQLKMRLRGVDPGAVQREVQQAVLFTNTRIGGAHLTIAAPRAPGMGAEPNVGDELVSALFSDPRTLVPRLQPPPEPMWWERSYFGMPVWALGAALTLGGGYLAWYRIQGTRRRRQR
ncbi:MAG TPA: hypothetical protein VIY27_02740 [Myxococcota bacterium]